MMYHGEQMRRGVSILLALILCAGPVAAAFPATDDLRLPACCRRNGAHHCSMAWLGEMQSSVPSLRAPATCPAYRNALLAILTPVHASAITRTWVPTLTSAVPESSSFTEVPLSAPIRTRAGRGPPQSILL
jgi:hypothetical protein